MSLISSMGIEETPRSIQDPDLETLGVKELVPLVYPNEQVESQIPGNAVVLVWFEEKGVQFNNPILLDVLWRVLRQHGMLDTDDLIGITTSSTPMDEAGSRILAYVYKTKPSR